jgi:hypothetical protein
MQQKSKLHTKVIQIFITVTITRREDSFFGEEAKPPDGVALPSIRCYVNIATILKRNGDICKGLNHWGKNGLFRFISLISDSIRV